MGRKREEEGGGEGAGGVTGKRTRPVSEDKSSEVGQLSGLVNSPMLSDLGTITFC